MDKEEKLRQVLENVSDSYPDFVDGGLMESRHYPDYADKIIAFIEANPDATTSDIILYETEEIFGIKPLV